MYEYKCEVTRVVDGDTVDVIIDCGFSILHKARVRMYGIDTPESRTRDLDEKARGKLASQYIQDHIDNGNEIIIKTEKDSKGKFGRILGKIFIDGKDINQSMIDEHLAVAYHGQSKADIELAHLQNRSLLIEKGIYNPSL
tara:strand:+ start:22764 stop:23183 length:420 start_codon:yes stop_codon:yes gene_type:complete